MIFRVDADIKEEFLQSQPTATAKSNMYVLQLADEYEAETNKKIYDLSISELKEMFAVKFKNSSRATIDKNRSVLSKYIDFCINKNIVTHYENRLSAFTKLESKQLVNKQALRYKYITPEQLSKYRDMLFNAQDRLLLTLPYVGVRGRTQVGDTCEEIINLRKPSDDDILANRLVLTKNNGEKRTLRVDQEVMELVLDAFKQESYYGNNGEETAHLRQPMKISVINPHKDYVLRVPGAKRGGLINPTVINSRMSKFKKWLGNKYISINNLYMSGMISSVLKLMEERGTTSLDRDDYINICDKFDYRSAYWYIIRDQALHYLEVKK
jgi:hypothetical protein